MAAGVLRQVERELLRRLKAAKNDKSACELGRLILDIRKRPKPEAFEGGQKTNEKADTPSAGLPDF